jgi:rhodanese-related sulfurtransferase
VVLDVREPHELQLAAIAGVLHIPMGHLSARISELDPKRRVAVLCHHGVRSWHVASWLDAQGFEEVYNIAGGIAEWAEWDPSVGRY